MRDKSHPTPPPRQEARDRKKRARRPPPPTASPTAALPGPRPERLGYQGPRRDEAEPPGSLRGLAAEWRPVGSRQARPGPPGSAASEPWDRANSRRPLGLGVPIQRVGVTLAPAPHPGMNNDPTPGLAAASVTVRTPARALSSGGTEGSWQRLPARCPSWGGAGAGSPGWGGWGQGGGPTPTPEETGPASLPTQRQLSGAWHRLRPERPCRGEAATPPPASQVGLRASRPTPRPTAQRAPGPRVHRLPRRVRARPLPCAWAARTGGWQRGAWPPGLGALGAPSQTLLLPEASAPDLVPRLRCHLLGGVPDPAPDHPRRWPDTLVITRPHYLPPDLGLSGYR